MCYDGGYADNRMFLFMQQYGKYRQKKRKAQYSYNYVRSQAIKPSLQCF